jgi:hypothetical protein
MPINPKYNFLNGDAQFGEQAFRGGMALWGGPQEQAPRATPYIPGGLSNTDIEAVNAARQPMAQPMQAPRPAQRMAAPAPMAAPVAAPDFPIPGEPPGLVEPQQGSQIIESDLPPEPEQPEMQTRILPPQEPALPQGFENTEIAKRGQAMGMDPRQILVALAEFSAGMGNIKGKPQQSTARSFYEMQKKYEQQNRQNAMGDLQMAQRAMPKPIEPIDPVTQQYKQMQIDYLKSKMQPKPVPEVDTLKRDLTQAQIDLTRARQRQLEPTDAQLPQQRETQARNEGERIQLKNVPSVSVAGFEKVADVGARPLDLEKFRNSATTFKTLIDKIDRYKSMIDKYGAFENPYSNAGAEMQSLARQIQLDAKNQDFFALGVLAGPDLDLLESVIPTSSKLSNILMPASSAKAQIDSFKNNLENKLTDKAASLGFRRAKPLEETTIPGNTTGPRGLPIWKP